MRLKDNDDNTGISYKIKDLKVFGSKENLFHNQKKYRVVYDEHAARYLYCELSFYNKLFDESDWETKLTFVCLNKDTNEKLCELDKNVKVSSEKNIIYVREGWGTPEPGWWKRGRYCWEVYMEGIKIGDIDFYIVDGGHVASDNNSYFETKTIKLFESSRDGIAIDKRVYLKEFASQDTRYINVELCLENKYKHDYFPLELHFNFYNEAGQHKAFMSYFREIKQHKGEIILDTGYGSDNIGYWYKDAYTLEVIFMGQIIAVVPFNVGDSQQVSEGSLAYNTIKKLKAAQEIEQIQPVSFEEAKGDLEKLIGLRTVKAQINELSTYLKFLKIRKDKGLEEDQKFNLHSIFKGNPGTGKTTVAHMLGRIYNSLGLLSHGKVFEVGRADLVGEFIGQTAPKVKKAIEKARGGILFVDEAYALTNRGNDGKDFGREVIEVLLKEMSDGEGDIAIICAGYPKEMTNFLDSNPGLNSRIKHIINFPDYTPDELMDISEFTAIKRGVRIDQEANKFINKRIYEIYRNRDDQFGNARFINGLIEEAKQNMALRLMSDTIDVSLLEANEISTLTTKDMEKFFDSNNAKGVEMPIDEELLQSSLSQLHDLVGLHDLKQEVDEMVKLVRYYKDIGRDVRKAFSLHTVFKGNPGTGKTTIARIMVQLYKALGILERGHLIECDRKSLVAGYVGQTAIKTSELIDKAMGGGLFIDEAYSLVKGGTGDFGREAIETLLKKMEDHRGEFMVIVAGYPDEMSTFIEANPGLMSRFDKQFLFKDYTAAELLLIAKMMLDKEELKLDEMAESHLIDYIDTLVQSKHKYFGNARTMRKVIKEAIKRQNLRMADVPHADRDWMLIHTIQRDDVQGFQLMENESQGRKSIGFR
jgi:SpoVK/Ycf46/Vps4 family AAA+-type ATPase